MAIGDKPQREYYKPGTRLLVPGKGVRVVDTAEFNEDGSVTWTDTEGDVHRSTWTGG